MENNDFQKVINFCFVNKNRKRLRQNVAVTRPTNRNNRFFVPAQ